MDVLQVQLQSFCPFSESIQVVGRDHHHHHHHHDEFSSATTSESESSKSPGVCKTPPEPQDEWAHTQPAVPRLVEPETRFEATELPRQTFAFDFDVDNGVWFSTDPYLQSKDQPDWFTLCFPEPLT